ncbi:hypothetical protein IAR55_005863 [Kwoniella newhampshirensis]|uniref:Uncharacterized protein n=1 Tax=Kwoniella newhampshirensis TaxID=1651941 RepID=A0AAW0YUV6_9TREE
MVISHQNWGWHSPSSKHIVGLAVFLFFLLFIHTCPSFPRILFPSPEPYSLLTGKSIPPTSLRHPLIIFQHIPSTPNVNSAATEESGEQAESVYEMSERSLRIYAEKRGYGYWKSTGVNEEEEGMDELDGLISHMRGELVKGRKGAKWIFFTSPSSFIINPLIALHHLLPPRPLRNTLLISSSTREMEGTIIFPINHRTFAFLYSLYGVRRAHRLTDFRETLRYAMSVNDVGEGDRGRVIRKGKIVDIPEEWFDLTYLVDQPMWGHKGRPPTPSGNEIKTTTNSTSSSNLNGNIPSSLRPKVRKSMAMASALNRLTTSRARSTSISRSIWSPKSRSRLRPRPESRAQRAQLQPSSLNQDHDPPGSPPLSTPYHHRLPPIQLLIHLNSSMSLTESQKLQSLPEKAYEEASKVEEDEWIVYGREMDGLDIWSESENERERNGINLRDSVGRWWADLGAVDVDERQE